MCEEHSFMCHRAIVLLSSWGAEGFQSCQMFLVGLPPMLERTFPVTQAFTFLFLTKFGYNAN